MTPQPPDRPQGDLIDRIAQVCVAYANGREIAQPSSYAMGKANAGETILGIIADQPVPEQGEAQGLGTYQAEYEAELQSGNDPLPTEENE